MDSESGAAGRTATSPYTSSVYTTQHTHSTVVTWGRDAPDCKQRGPRDAYTALVRRCPGTPPRIPGWPWQNPRGSRDSNPMCLASEPLACPRLSGPRLVDPLDLRASGKRGLSAHTTYTSVFFSRDCPSRLFGGDPLCLLDLPHTLASICSDTRCFQMK